MKKGFTMFFNGKDYFFITNRDKITDSLISEIFNLIFPNKVLTEENKKYIRVKLLKATIEIKGKINPYYNIKGDNFGGYGSFVSENKTIIHYLSK